MAQDLQAWARAKFGALVDQYQPTEQELAHIEDYYKQHPGAPTTTFVNLLASSRGTRQGPMPVTPGQAGQAGVPAPPASPSLWDTASQVAGGAAKKPTTTGAQSLSAQIAAALKDQGATGGAGPSMDAFDPKATVYIDGTAPVSQVPTPGGLHAPGTSAPEATTFQDVLTGLYKMDDPSLKALKQRLWAGGFYPPGTDKSIVDSSVPDVKTRNAYLLAVQQSARLAEAGHQTTVSEVIALGNPDPADATGAAALGPYTITNPADLKEALQSAAQERLGMNLSPDEIKKYSALYQGMEAQSSIRAQALGRNNQQGAVLAPPSAAAGAQDYIDQHFAAQEQGYGSVQRMFEFQHMLGAAGS